MSSQYSECVEQMDATLHEFANRLCVEDSRHGSPFVISDGVLGATGGPGLGGNSVGPRVCDVAEEWGSTLDVQSPPEDAVVGKTDFRPKCKCIPPFGDPECLLHGYHATERRRI